MTAPRDARQHKLTTGRAATKVVFMEIVDDARKHEFPDEDIWHAFRNPIRVWDFDGYEMRVGPARDGTLLEVGVNLSLDHIFHADAARPKYLGLPRSRPRRNR